MGKEFEGNIVLASKGIFYGDGFKSGSLNVEPWGTKEERLLVSPNIDFNDTLDRLIIRLTDCPIPPHKLLLVDRQHIFFYMRCLSYGGDYTFRYKCDECGRTVSHDLDLEKDLEVKYVDDHDFLKSIGVSSIDEVREPFEFTLPRLGKRIGWRLLRGEDEKSVDQYVRRVSSKGGSDERPDYMYRLALRIMEIDGKKAELGEALDLVEKIKGKDALELRNQIEKIDIGINTELEVTCKNCGYLNEVILPMEKAFFRPRGKDSQG